MKKFLLAAFAAIFCSAIASAQLVESRTGGAHIYKVKNPPPEMRYTLKLSGGIVSMDEASQTSTGTAADISFGVERHFKYNSIWYWGGKIGVGMTHNSFKWDAYDDTSTEYYEPTSWKQGYTRHEGYKADANKDNLNLINFHIGPTIGFCKPISTNTKLNISITPEFVYLVSSGDRYIESEGTWYSYGVYDDGTTYGDPNGEYRCTTYAEPGEYGFSGTLSADLIINKFIIGINGKYVHAFGYDYGNGCSHYTIMASIGYAF